MIIDCNIHHIPEDLFENEKMLKGFLASAPRGYGDIAYLGETENGVRQVVIEKPKGYTNLNNVEGDYTLEKKLQAMDENGVDVGLLRVAPVWSEWLDLELCKMVNDSAAETCRRANGRLFANAIVPPWNDKDNIYELERCIKELGCVGVQVACHYGELYLDDEAFRPFFRAVDKMDIPVTVHHTPLPVQWQSIYEYKNLRRELGRIIDQSTAVGRELFSGMFDECPNLKLIHTMLGGNWFANYHIMAPTKFKKPEATSDRLDTSGSERIQQYLKNNIYFDLTHPASWGKKIIECAIETCGADHMLFGSTFPVFYNWMSDGIAFMKSLDVTAEEYELMMSGNAKRLFHLKV